MKNKDKNTRLPIPLIVSILIVSIFALSGIILDVHDLNKETVHANYVDVFGEELVEGGSNEELMLSIDENIHSLSKEEAGKVVEGLMFRMSERLWIINQNTDFINQITDMYLQPLYSSENTEAEALSLEQAVVNLEKEGYVIIKKNGLVEVNINYPMLIEKYGDFIPEDLETILCFYLSLNEDIFDYAQETVNIEEVGRRIVETEVFFEKYKDSDYEGEMVESNIFYINLYFGLDGVTYIYDEDGLIKQEVLKAYEEIVQKYPDTEIAQKTQLLLNKIETIGAKQSPDMTVFLMELCKKNK